MIQLEAVVDSSSAYLGLKAINAALDVDSIADECTAIILNRIRSRYLDEMGPTGRWTPSDAGLRRRAAGGTGTLFDTGTLFHSIQAAKDGDGVRRFATDVPYAKHHQRGKGKMFRPFLYYLQDDLTVVDALIRKRVEALG